MNVRSMFCSLAILIAGVGMADAPSWPSDYDSKLSAHIAASQPKGDAVGETEFSWFNSFAFSLMVSAPFGSVESPFDSFWFRSAWTEGSIIDGREPRGLYIRLW